MGVPPVAIAGDSYRGLRKAERGTTTVMSLVKVAPAPLAVTESKYVPAVFRVNPEKVATPLCGCRGERAAQRCAGARRDRSGRRSHCPERGVDLPGGVLGRNGQAKTAAA